MSIEAFGVMALAFAVVAALAFGAFASIALGARVARYLFLPYFAVLVLFSGATWGVVDDALQNTIYTRGTGFTYIGFVNLYLYWLGLMALVGALWNRLPPPQATVRRYLAAIGVVLAAHVVVGTYLDVPFLQIASKAGALHMFNMVVLVFVLLRVFRSERDIAWLVQVFLVLALGRALFGLGRFVFFGGDPANFYANFQKISVRLTFFDINDSVILGVAAFIAVWRLLSEDRPAAAAQSAFLWVTAMSSTLCVVLSYRRTAWIGLLLAGLFLLWAKRRQVNWAAVVPLGTVLLVGLGAAWFSRFQAHAGSGLLATLFPDIASGGSISGSYGRFVELELATRTIRDHWLLGVGTWGEYAYSNLPEVSFHKGRFEFMHSGFLHVWLKTGLIGLALFVGALLSTSRQSLRGLSGPIPDRWKAVSAAGLAGVVLFLPTLLFGTPIIEFRTMQILGLVLALPFLAASAGTAVEVRPA